MNNWLSLVVDPHIDDTCDCRTNWIDAYEYNLGAAASWRIFDARAFLDFGTRREVDLRNNFLDFGGQLSTGIVF